MASASKVPSSYGYLNSSSATTVNSWRDNTASTSTQVYNYTAGYHAVAYEVHIGNSSEPIEIIDGEIAEGSPESSSATVTYNVTSASLEVRINNTSFAPSNANFQCDIYKGYPFTSDNLLGSQTFSKEDDTYPITRRFSFSGLNAAVNGTVYFVLRKTNYNSGIWDISNASAAINYTIPSLAVGVTPSELYVGSSITASFTNRFGQTLTVRAYYNTTLLYETTASSDSIQITCPASWFSTAGISSNSMTVRLRASDGLGRTSSDATFALRTPVLTMTLDKNAVVIGDTITATFGERIGRTVSLSFVTTKNNSIITLYTGTVASDSITVTCPKTWFTSHSQLDHENTISVQVVAVAGNNLVTKTFEFKYTTLGVDVRESTITVGNNFTFDVTNRESERLTVTMRAKGYTVATETADEDTHIIATDINYFNNAQDSRSTSLNVTVTVSDKRGRTASDTFSLSAYGSSMFPVINSVQSSIVQPSNVSENYPNTYIANISKVKISVSVSFPTVAGASRTVVNYSGTSMNLSYNQSTGLYEATTVNPITEDTEFQVSITDERGLKTISKKTVTGVVDYSAPIINIINYHRCDSDHTANDSGAYCELTVEYTISPINNTNVGTAGVSSTIYTDSQPLQSYTQQIVYFFAADIEHSYDIVVSLVDKILSDSRTVVLSTAGVIMDFLAGGKGIGLGKVAELQKCVEVNPEWKLKAATIELNGTDLGTLLAQIQQRLTNGGL